MDYKDLRLQICQQRKILSKTELTAHSHEVFKNLLSLPEFQNAHSIGAYMAANGEIETTELIEYCWQNQKKIYLPKLLANFKMQFCEYSPDDTLVENRYKVLEPSHMQPEDSTKFDLVLVPMVAFDDKGHRIGMGAGYYDRHFEYMNTTDSNKPLLIGIGHSFQKINPIVTQPWDVNMHMIITELNVTRFKITKFKIKR